MKSFSKIIMQNHRTLDKNIHLEFCMLNNLEITTELWHHIYTNYYYQIKHKVWGQVDAHITYKLWFDLNYGEANETT